MEYDEGAKGQGKDISQPHKVAANSRYYVKVDGAEMAVFSEVSGLQVETEVFDYAEGGNLDYIHRLPGQTKAGNVTLKRGVVKGNELYKWYQHIMLGVMDLRNVTITLTDTAHNPMVSWKLEAAFPCKWSGPQLTIGSEMVAVETLEIAHKGWIDVS